MRHNILKDFIAIETNEQCRYVNYSRRIVSDMYRYRDDGADNTSCVSIQAADVQHLHTSVWRRWIVDVDETGSHDLRISGRVRVGAARHQQRI